jgi:hypothetical protein
MSLSDGGYDFFCQAVSGKKLGPLAVHGCKPRLTGRINEGHAGQIHPDFNLARSHWIGSLSNGRTHQENGFVSYRNTLFCNGLRTEAIKIIDGKGGGCRRWN